MKIVVEVKGWDDLKKIASRYPEASKTHINWAIRRAIISIQGDSMKNAPKDTGRLAGSLRTKFGDFWGVLEAGAGYALPVHEGTKPHFPPTSALEGWVRRHFGVSGKQAQSIAFLIARKISQTGTRPRPFMRDAVGVNEVRIDQDFNTALNNIVNSL